MELTAKAVKAKLRETWPHLDPVNVVVHADGVDIRLPAGPTTRGPEVQQYIANKLREIDGRTYELVDSQDHEYRGQRLLFAYRPVAPDATRED